MTSSLVGSEMCIRDRTPAIRSGKTRVREGSSCHASATRACVNACTDRACLLYTSDAADDM
eukprot:3553965-Prorocentrum_lima.AAC.1